MSDQQQQAQAFFKGHADQWQEKSTDRVYSLIADRHRAVHQTLGLYPKSSYFLDVGCGTGQLAIEASEKGYLATGIDYAEEMIEVCRANAKQQASNAKFELSSMFDYSPQQRFEVISAQGFIEYLALPELSDFFGFLRRHLKPGGSVAIGSRNRLFNLFSLNEFTKLEVDLGNYESLLQESMVVREADSQEQLIQQLLELYRNQNVTLPADHKFTGIDVSTRHQFSPGDLIARFDREGFAAKRIFPVHFHAFVPQDNFPPDLLEMRKNIANAISIQFQDSYQLLQQSSSFVVEARLK